MTRAVQLLLYLALGVALFSAALGLRRYLVTAQSAAYGYELPFTLESALHARRIQQIAEEGGLPGHDPSIGYPQGIRPAEVYSLGSEYLVAAAAKGLPSALSWTSRLRWLHAAWFSLGAVAVFAWIARLYGSPWPGFTAGLFYAVSVASVVRSTGMELSRENEALPLLAAHLAAMAFARSSGGAGRWVALTVSALLLGAASIAWDLVQWYLVLWAVWALWRGLRSPSPAEQGGLLLHVVILVGVGLAHPYLRTHHFWASPGMVLAFGVLAALWCRSLKGGRRGWPGWPWLVPVLLVAVATAWIVYGGPYGHFAELLWAKLRWLNQKPADPALLTFNQRMMWVPALHSADWRLTLVLFPSMVLLTLAAGWAAALSRASHVSSDVRQNIFYLAASFAAFVLFVRFHVFVALFVAGAWGMLHAWAAGRRGRARRWVLLLVLVGVSVEASMLVLQPMRWQRTGVDYRQLEELRGWFAQDRERGPVLADFGTSAFIHAYADRPIILHPKFEEPAIRETTRAFAEHLFLKNEAAFRAWMLAQGATTYVHVRGQLEGPVPEFQMRYMVNALEPPEEAAVRLFEYGRPGDARYFHQVWESGRYRVYRVLSAAAEREAGERSAQARRALQTGRLNEARRLALDAVERDPGREEARQLLETILRLEQSGFEYEQPGGN